MLYGDGTGLLATIESVDSTTKTIITLDSVRNLIEGMVIDVYNGETKSAGGLRIKYVDRINKKIHVTSYTQTFAKDYKLYVQNSKGYEISGLGKIFSDSDTLYGVSRSDYPWLVPYTKTNAGQINDSLIQTAIDYLEEVTGSNVNYIACSSKVRRMYQEYLGAYRRNIDVMELQGGYKAITYNGIPLVADRFVEDDAMYLLNTDDFTLHQLCDWKWLEGEDGKVLKQNAGYPTYSATLVKYAELVCDRPNGQAKITGITAITSNGTSDSSSDNLS